MTDKYDEYELIIAPLVFSLKQRCYECGIPFFISAAVANLDGGTVYKNEMVSPLMVNADLLDDKISRYVNVLSGFNTVLPKEAIEIEMPPLGEDEEEIEMPLSGEEETET